jgi:hypothetical protein
MDVLHPQALRWRRRADRLAWLAEGRADAEPCRNVAAEVDRLREAAAKADQAATIAEIAPARTRRR